MCQELAKALVKDVKELQQSKGNKVESCAQLSPGAITSVLAPHSLTHVCQPHGHALQFKEDAVLEHLEKARLPQRADVV